MADNLHFYSLRPVLSSGVAHMGAHRELENRFGELIRTPARVPLLILKFFATAKFCVWSSDPIDKALSLTNQVTLVAIIWL